MALATTAGQLLVNEILPPALRSYARVLDKKGINELLHKVAQDYPDQYRDISFRLNKLGERVAYQSGGNSFNVQALRGTPKVELLRQQIRDEMEGIINDPSLDSKGRNTKIVSTLQKHSPVLQKLVFDEALRNNNPLARQVLSGARGNPSQLNSLIGADLLYADHRDQPVPVPILRSYSQGLSPVEYFAAAYGARKGVIDLKKGTADAGYVGKQLNQLAHREVVTALDAEEDDPSAPIRGLPVDVDDPDNEGALLAQPVAGLPRNTPLTPEVLRYLQRKKIENILIRSPMVGGPTEGGIYARDAGIREGGGLPGIGESVGNATAQGGSEPLTQAKISSKHSGGVSGQSKAIGGFDYINALLQAPKTVKGGGVHAEVDGLVDRVEEAPAGGWHVWIGGESHYVPQGRTLGVKAGQRVEAGDMLSDGVPNPMTVVQHKGHGEGRRYWMQKANEAYKDAGIKYSRRNLEIIARGLIDHVQLTDDAIDSDGVPDDIVPYQELESRYQPREGTINSPLSSAKGLYLEKPVLHYTVGTKVRPSVLGQLQKFGVDRIDVHPDPPSFKPTMIRASRTLVYDPDWMTRLYGSSLKGSLLEAAHRGRVSREDSTSFVPSLARGVDFGYKGHFQPPEPPTKLEAPAIPLAAAPGESAMRKAGEMRLWSCTCGACQHTFGHKQVDPEEGYPRGGKCPKCGNAAFGGLEKEAELRPEVPGTTSEVTAMTTTKAPAAPEAPKLPAPPKPGGLLGNRSSLASINYRDPDLVSQFRQGLPSGPSPRPTPVPPSIPAAPSAGASRAPAAPTPPVAPPPAPVPSQYIAPPAPAPTALLNPATRANAPGLQGLVQFAAAPVTKLTDMAQERFPGLRPSSYFQNPKGSGRSRPSLGARR